jgi:hypothetical protein
VVALCIAGRGGVGGVGFFQRAMNCIALFEWAELLCILLALAAIACAEVDVHRLDATTRSSTPRGRWARPAHIGQRHHPFPAAVDVEVGFIGRTQAIDDLALRHLQRHTAQQATRIARGRHGGALSSAADQVDLAHRLQGQIVVVARKR